MLSARLYFFVSPFIYLLAKTPLKFIMGWCGRSIFNGNLVYTPQELEMQNQIQSQRSFIKHILLLFLLLLVNRTFDQRHCPTRTSTLHLGKRYNSLPTMCLGMGNMVLITHESYPCCLLTSVLIIHVHGEMWTNDKVKIVKIQIVINVFISQQTTLEVKNW